jgi:hypothetical protein
MALRRTSSLWCLLHLHCDRAVHMEVLSPCPRLPRKRQCPDGCLCNLQDAVP